MNKLIFIFCTYWIVLPANSANFINGKIGQTGYSISVMGNINPGDALIFQSKIIELKKEYQESDWKKKNKDWKFFLNVDLNSKGGSLNEAMKIGYIVRDYEAQTFVPYKMECLSSCVFILAAGVNRNVYGKVGVHRPYFEDLDPNASKTEIRAMREEMKKRMIKYLNDMDISESIIDEMLSIEPDKIKILSEDDLTKYRLTVMDADHEEKMISEEAQNFNLTSSVYRQRKFLSQKKCGYITTAIQNNSVPEYLKCQNMVILNITEIEYVNRESKVKANCANLEKGANRNKCFFDARILGK